MRVLIAGICGFAGSEVLESTRAALEWEWRPTTSLASILEEVATHAEQNPDWLERSWD